MVGDCGVSDLVDCIGCGVFVDGGVVTLVFGVVDSVVVCDCSCLGAGVADILSDFCSSCLGCDIFSILEAEVFSSLISCLFEFRRAFLSCVSCLCCR